MRTSSEIFIGKANNTLTIAQSWKSFIESILYFCILCLFILAGMYFFYFFLKSKITIWAFICSAVTILTIYFLLNRKRLKRTKTTLRLNQDLLILNEKIIYDISCPKKIVLYEFVGETLINAEGNLYLSLNNNEFPLAFSATAHTIDQIHKELDSFFGEAISFEKGGISL